MKKLGERIKISIPKGVTQKEFAQKNNLSLGTLQSWIHGRVSPSVENLEFLANALNKSVSWLVTGIDNDTAGLLILPIYDVEFAAGDGACVDEEKIIYNYSFPENFFKEYDLSKNTAIGLFVRGDSMEPKLYDGDVVVVDRSVKTFKNDGIYAFRYDSQCYIKSLQRIAGELRAVSFNKNYEAWTIKDNSDFKIIGRVKAVIGRI